MSLPYVSLKRPPRHPDRGHSPTVTTTNWIPRNTTTIFYRYPFAGKLV